jgi:hypothetical protein
LCGREDDCLQLMRISLGVTQPSITATMNPVEAIEDPEVAEFAKRAEQFLSGFRWCGQILGAELAWATAGVLGVFRIRISPAEPDVDEIVWVVTGDLPSAYLGYEPEDTWQDALQGYVSEMQLWVDAAKGGESVSDLIPVNVAPTPENAARLEDRLTFIRTRLLAVPADSLESDT